MAELKDEQSDIAPLWEHTWAESSCTNVHEAARSADQASGGEY